MWGTCARTEGSVPRRATPSSLRSRSPARARSLSRSRGGGSCASATLDDGWVTGDLGGSLTGTFSVDFSAAVSMVPSDALFGLSNGAASYYTDLATIARFNPGGGLDARNGDAYAASSDPFGANGMDSYAAGPPPHLRLDIKRSRIPTRSSTSQEKPTSRRIMPF